MTASKPPAPLEITLEFAGKPERPERASLDFQPTEYTLRCSDGDYQEAQFLWDESIAELLRSTYAKNPDVSAVETVAARIRKLVPRGALRETLIRDSEYRAPVRIALKAQAEAEELYTLPWELMPLDNSGRRLADLPDTLIRYEALETKTTAEENLAREGGRILFAWSSAGGDVPVTEHRDLIRSACQGSDVRFDPSSDELAEVTFKKLNDILEKAVAEQRPYTAIHLLCHGGPVRSQAVAYGLVWTEGELQQRVTISPPDFARLLGQFTSTLRLVNLCACGSGNPGELGNLIDSTAMRVHKLGVESVIATRFELRITSALTFFRVLFNELLLGQKSLESAFIAARKALFKSASYLDYASMQLYGRVRDGWDTRPFVLRPYRGLQAFRPEHRGFFFGRDEEVGALVARLGETLTGQRPPFQIVAGASGTGKSSLVLAGVVPALKDRGWRVQIIRPATTSLAALRALQADESVSTATTACPMLIATDQLEELFGMTPEDADAWLQVLWSSAERPGVVVVCTLREDFLARCAELKVEAAGRRLDEIAHEEAHRLFLNRISVTRTKDGGLDYARWEQIIVEPARRVGISLEPGLLQRLLDDVADEPGVLPLLEYALDALWAAREGRVMTNVAYDALGSVVGALTRTATAMAQALAPSVTAQLRRILLNLIEIQADGTLRRRRPALLDEIRPEDPQQGRDFDLAEEALLRHRLVIKGQSDEGHPWLELAHEALGKRWEMLKQWAKEESVMLHLRADLATDAERWTNNRATADGGASYLWRGLRLQDAVKRSAEINPDAIQRSFLEASKRAEAERGEPPQENLELQGWGVVAPVGEKGDRLLARIDELIRHRCGQQRREVRVYRVPPGMDAASTVRWRQMVHQDPLTRPDERPNYLLILGDIDEISAEFQQELSATLMVGRLAFRSEEDYTLYAQKVLRSEQVPTSATPQVLFASWVGEYDRVLGRALRNFIEPCIALAERAKSEGRLPCSVSSVPLQGGSSAPWKETLLQMVSGDSPGLLVMVSHGKTLQTRTEPAAVEQQRAEQGAILFSARESFLKAVTMTLTGGELSTSPFMPNGFVLLLANLGAGTPQYDVFMPILVEMNPTRSNNFRVLNEYLPKTDQSPFIAALPQAILANPNGALGVISCLGPAMTSAFERDNKPDVAAFYRAIERIGQGSRAGVAIAALHSEVSALSVEVAALLDHERSAQILGQPYSGDPLFRGGLQLRRQALRVFILLGDPAARLPRATPVDPLSFIQF